MPTPPRPPPLGSATWLKSFRGTQRWRILAAEVVKAEPICWLRLPGCTTISTCADHVIPASVAPQLAFTRSNLRGSCRPCNAKRAARHFQDPALRKRKARNGKQPHMNGNHPRTTAPIKQITPAHKTPARAYLEFFFPNEKGNADPDSLNG